MTKLLTCVLEILKKSDYVQSPEEKWENPFGRRFESELQKELLLASKVNLDEEDEVLIYSNESSPNTLLLSANNPI